MQIGIPAETVAGETRVAATPETVKKYVQLGYSVVVQSGAGVAASCTDEAYQQAGATIAATAADTYKDADLVLKVRAPSADETALIKQGAAVLGIYAPHSNPHLDAYAARGIDCYAMELIPRITRAQSADVLSSQANLAGYKAVLMAANEYQRLFPMLMTAAGTVKPARVVILGVGVAGLQAIATAKRLGAVVEANDVRPAVKEQVESLGGKYIEVQMTDEEKKSAETAGGYAREMSDDYKRRQVELVAKHVSQADIVITTALIPGRAAPVLVTEEMVKSMKPGSVIVDLAAPAGGNCPLTEAGKTVVKHGVTLVGETNLPALVAADSSSLYARNVLDFLKLVFNKEGQFHVDLEDDIVKACLMCRDGQLLRA